MKIRKAVLKDAKGIAKVHVDSWRSTYKNIVPDEYLNQLSYEQRENMWKKILPNGSVFVAETEDGSIVGFASGGEERSKNYPNYKGELYAIYILKEFQGRGLGKSLVHPIVMDLKDKNISSMTVIVLEKNRSRYFYEKLGAKKIDAIETEIYGQKLNELVYGWDDTAIIFGNRSS